MAKPLPLKLWLALEDDVARHKVAVARNFAEARARLLPEPPMPPLQDWKSEHARWQMEQLARWQGNAVQHQNMMMQAYGSERGLFGLGILGL